MKKEVLLGVEALTKLLEGMDEAANAVKSTLGPDGRLVIIQKESVDETGRELDVSKDGVTVAESISYVDPVKNMGAKLITETALKTVQLIGDGTTTATVIAQMLINQALIKINEKKITRNQIIEEITSDLKIVMEELKSMCIQVDTPEQLFNIATISANNDPELGKIIAEAFMISNDVRLRLTENTVTTVEKVEGMSFDGGLFTPHLINNPATMERHLKNCHILLCDMEIINSKQLLKTFEWFTNQQPGKELLIICKSMEHPALQFVTKNFKDGNLPVCASTIGEIGLGRTITMTDVATMTGATIIGGDTGRKLAEEEYDEFDPTILGFADEIFIGQYRTRIVGVHGDKQKIEERITDLKDKIAKAEGNQNERDHHRGRLARMTGGSAIINLGAQTMLQMKELGYRAEDAIEATRAAKQGGFLPGGGIALLNAAKKLDKESVLKIAIEEPFNLLCEHSGFKHSTVHGEITRASKGNPNYGLNCRNRKYGDMIEMGVIDPYKVTLIAMQNACGVAAIFIKTSAVIYNVPETNGN